MVDNIQNERQLQVIDSRDVLGRRFEVYGTFEEPLFLAKDVAEMIEHEDVSSMLRNIDEDEKMVLRLLSGELGGNPNKWFLTENGLYEVLFQSRKPIAKAFK
ncbi:MAG: Bro-N domain-containing protein, partial [Thermoguttaceae bacterium]|nr:Bro-N domain-containing protein [Thermoguttaceae bacterium]